MKLLLLALDRPRLALALTLALAAPAAVVLGVRAGSAVRCRWANVTGEE